MSTRSETGLSGQIGDLGFATLLDLLAAMNATGSLDIEGPTAGSIEFVDGAIRFATSASSVTERELVESIADFDDDTWERLAGTGDPLGAARESLSAPRAALAMLAKEVIVDALFELQLAGDQAFAFKPCAPRSSAITVPTAELVDTLAQRIEAWHGTAARIGSITDVVRISPHLDLGDESVTIDAADWSLLAAVDGKRTLATIVNRSGRGAFRAVTSLERLIEAGVLERVE